MAGFEVYLNGRFWVSPEAVRTLLMNVASAPWRVDVLDVIAAE